MKHLLFSWYQKTSHTTLCFFTLAVLLSINTIKAQPNYGMRDDGGVNLPTVTYWYTDQSADITEKGAQFNNKNFGTITSFIFKGASIQVWKTAGGDVTGAQFKYKVWKQGESEPANYTVRHVNWTSEYWEGSTMIQTWANFGSPIEIAQGLEGGNYNVMILFSITGTGTPGITENGPFTATFTIPVVSNAAEILSFVLAEQDGPAEINSTNASVNIAVVYGTNLTSLTPTIVVSPGAQISPASGVAQDFSSPRQYVVTAQDGVTTKTWTVTVSVAPPKYSVTFIVDMTPAITAGQFNPNTDFVDVAGTFNNWNGSGPMSHLSGNLYSHQTAAIFTAGQQISYKYRINGSWSTAEFPNGDNRNYTVVAGENIINNVYNQFGSATPQITFANLQWPGSATVTAGTNVDIYSQVTIENGTLTSTGYDGLQVWVGVSTTNTNPNDWTNWYLAGYNGVSSFTGRPEYKYTINTTGLAEGTYYYASRFNLGSGEYVYGGFSSTGGGYWDGTTNISGVLTISGTVTTYPVTFTVNNNNSTVTAVKIKGSFNSWTLVLMDNVSGNVWEKTFQIQPGSYEWGITDQNDEWLLPPSQNLSFSVDATGNIQGQTSYTIPESGTTGEVAILDRWIKYTAGQNATTVAGTDFHSSNLGTFTSNASLSLNGGGVKSLKSGDYDVTGAKIYYRYYKTSESPGNFTESDLPWRENLPEVGQQVWENITLDIPVSSGLSAGNYWLEVYFTISYKIGASTNIQTLTDNNNAANYKASFSVEVTNNISDYLHNYSLVLYPNPATDFLIINIPEQVKNYNVTVYNSLGQEVRSVRNSARIDLQNLSTGVYWVELRVECDFFRHKVMIIKK